LSYIVAYDIVYASNFDYGITKLVC